jgi:hypothetical protein
MSHFTPEALLHEEHQFTNWLRSVTKDDHFVNEILDKVHEYYYDPNNSIAFIYTIHFIKSLANYKLVAKLNDQECMNILAKLWGYFEQDQIVCLAYDLIEEEVKKREQS